MPLKATLPFLEGELRAAGEKKRNSAVVKSLRRSENLQLREEVMRCRQRCESDAPSLDNASLYNPALSTALKTHQ